MMPKYSNETYHPKSDFRIIINQINQIILCLTTGVAQCEENILLINLFVLSVIIMWSLQKYGRKLFNIFRQRFCNVAMEDAADDYGLLNTHYYKDNIYEGEQQIEEPLKLINNGSECNMNSMVPARSPSPIHIDKLDIFKESNDENKLQKSIEVIQVHSGKPVGLINPDSKCYMNSMVQALSSSPKLIDNLNGFNESICRNDKLKKFINVLQAINEPSNTMEDTTYKLKKFMQISHWNRPSQQDAFQLLSYFINSIHNEIENREKTMPPKFRILHSFTEDHKFNKIQDHLALAIPLCGDYANRSGVKLTKMIDEFFEPSLIDEGPHLTSMSLFGEAPEVLILHIQANEWSHDRGEYIKPTYYIKYEDTLKYKFTIHKKVDGLQKEDVTVTYRLRAVVKHTGNVGGGHYTTYRMYKNKWFLCNDRMVIDIPFEYDVVPYLMVYEKDNGS